MIPSASVEYIGKDLEAMDFAERYHRWILDLMLPYMGVDIVEVGAGTGSFSRMLLSTRPSSLTLVEPSKMFDSLEANLSTVDVPTKIRLVRDVFVNVAGDIGRPDTILYVNVLEHIEDDAVELRAAGNALAVGGRLLIFAPALSFLYSDFDRQIGHFRRYGMKDLKRKCEAAGFSVLNARWFDLPGIAPWLVKYRLMRSLTMESAAVHAYDRFAVPVIRRLESVFPPPVGKNILLVAEKRG